MTMPSGGLFDREALAHEESLARLEDARIARVLISVRCLPAALPVYLALSEHYVLIASGEEAVLDAARRGDVLAVQVDGIENDGTTWSVQATGVAHVPKDQDAIAELGVARLRQVLDKGATLVAVAMTVVRGERVRWTFPV
jgi:hypothetical protein